MTSHASHEGATRDQEGHRPRRWCTGGQEPFEDCNRLATLVACAGDGLHWYCCSAHTDGCKTMTIDEWWVFVDIQLAAEDTCARLRAMPKEDV